MDVKVTIDNTVDDRWYWFISIYDSANRWWGINNEGIEADYETAVNETITAVKKVTNKDCTLCSGCEHYDETINTCNANFWGARDSDDYGADYCCDVVKCGKYSRK